MDRQQLHDIISRLEEHMRTHDLRFADNPAHVDCRSRFLKVLSGLQIDLANKMVNSNVAKSKLSSYEGLLNFAPESDLGQDLFLNFAPDKKAVRKDFLNE